MPDQELVAVKRVYVTPERWDSPDADARIVDEVELWCVSCCTQYPHVIPGSDEDITPST
jgi:hypothetical protein